jgi:hypothetical protein
MNNLEGHKSHNHAPCIQVVFMEKAVLKILITIKKNHIHAEALEKVRTFFTEHVWVQNN